MTVYIIENNFLARGMANTIIYLYHDKGVAIEDFKRFRRNLINSHEAELKKGKFTITADLDYLIRIRNAKGQKIKFHEEFFLTDREI